MPQPAEEPVGLNPCFSGCNLKRPPVQPRTECGQCLNPCFSGCNLKL